MAMYRGSVLSSFLFTLIVDVVTELTRKGALSELLHAYDVLLMSETIYGLRD